MGSFQIVLFMNKYRKKQDNMINLIEAKVGDVFDAIYTRWSYKNDNKVIDYTQIFEDFNIRDYEIESKVAVIWPLSMELEEVKEREREDLLFIDSSQNYPYKNIAAECIPMNRGYQGNPLSILITSINTQSNRITTFARVTKLINLMMNVLDSESCKGSSNNSSEGEEETFSFVKTFKLLQNMIISKHINAKSALFSTTSISQAVSRKLSHEESIENFRETKVHTYQGQISKEEMLPISNAYLNLKNQNVHTLRHINQYYNDFYYELIEQEEEEIESRQGCDIIDVEITHRKPLRVGFDGESPEVRSTTLKDKYLNKVDQRQSSILGAPKFHLNRFIVLDHLVF